jgi:hypothetical protein
MLDVVRSDKQLFQKMTAEILSTEQRLQMHTDVESRIKLIIQDESHDYKTKIGLLTAILSKECKARSMPLKGVGFDNERKLVRIELPAPESDLSDDAVLLRRTLELIRYGILAIPLYNFFYQRFQIAEVNENKAEDLAIELTAADLDGYAKETIGLYDLLHDSKITLNWQPVTVEVDFEKLKAFEYTTIGRRFPRKER